MKNSISKFPIFDNFSYNFKNKIKKKKIKLNNCKIKLGLIGFKSLKVRRVSFREIESTRRITSLGLNKCLKILFKVVLNKPLCIKPIGSRMGKGRSNLCRWWVYNLQRGSVFCEIDCFHNILTYCFLKRLLTSIRKRFFSYSILVIRFGLNCKKEIISGI